MRDLLRAGAFFEKKAELEEKAIAQEKAKANKEEFLKGKKGRR